MFPKLKPVNCVVAFLSSAFQAFGMYNIHALSVTQDRAWMLYIPQA